MSQLSPPPRHVSNASHDVTHALETQLRAALRGTSEAQPRPLVPMELPLHLEKLLAPAMLRGFKPAAVLAPVLRRPGGLTMLFTLRASGLRRHGGQVSFPGGRREEDDASAAAAALREAEEEVGIDPAAVEVLGYLDDYPTITQYRVTPVVGLVDPPAAFRPDPTEVAEIFEVPLEVVLDPARYERKLFKGEGGQVPFLELKYGERVIWGATAGMLWNLVSKLREAA